MFFRSTDEYNMYSTLTIVASGFLFCSFLLNFGRQSYESSLVLPKSIPRVVGISLVSISYLSETIIVLAYRDYLDEINNWIIATIFFSSSWILTCIRQRLLVAEISGLSLISVAGSAILIFIPCKDLEWPAKSVLYSVLPSGRLLILVALLMDCIARWRADRSDVKKSNEAQPFMDASSRRSIDQDTEYGACSSYGWLDHQSDTSLDEDNSDFDEDETYQETSGLTELRKSGSWMVYLQNFKVFLPHLLPKNEFKVQICLVACVLCLLAKRFLNILVPLQLGIIIDILTQGEQPFKELLVYWALYLLQGDCGLGLVQSLAKIPVQQYSYRQLTNASFNHVMALSMEFHSSRDSAEVMKAIEQGEALTNILEAAVMDIAPTIIDMFVAFILLYLKFNSSVALCMMLASFAFLSVEVVTSSWNIKNRRRLTRAERKETRTMHQAVQGWQTVLSFNMFAYEKCRFGNAVDYHLSAKATWSNRDAYGEAMAAALIPTTFLVLAGSVAREVYNGRASMGDFVFLIQYWDNIVEPIQWLSHEYRWLMSDLVDAERLLDLLTTEPTIKDKVGAETLCLVEGRVEFNDVNFSYDDRRNVIHNVNISAPPGKTIALVGATGSGKSSIMKLLMRLYDIDSGSIKIDGRDIRDITQGSLLDILGIVPQDPLLFNSTIMENLRYARLSASPPEIFQACRDAAIHDKIVSFPLGYNTKVGEQGVKLSGGEIQRLAIARVFLKNPPVLILDEATSAVDTETESEIQHAFKRLSRKRTTFVIAHRLPTIVDADQILVLENGEIIERGTHHELLRRDGVYSKLWRKQLSD